MNKFASRLRQSQVARIATGAVLAMAGAAQAAADTSVIDSTKTDMLAFIAALLVLAVAVWGGKKVIGLFGKS